MGVSGNARSVCFLTILQGKLVHKYNNTVSNRLFQETFSRNLNEKYITLNGQLDKLVHDANSEIGSLRHKLEQMTIERGAMERKCMELGEAFREKSRKCLQFQVSYE